MDRFDREILAELQDDARVSVTALADRVHLSVSACHRRLRDLEASGVIAAYRAHLDPAAVDLAFQAIVFVTMREGDSRILVEFETAVTEIEAVTDAQRLFGQPDYLLRVATKDLDSFRLLYDETLGALPGVLRLSTTLVMKNLLQGRPLPL
ncbi:Lrp/AsnC family transcriptional regulator [Pseudoclavibacter helvolus]|uniref:DNA-binding Lrp family transcriptional regulator n=1 Tax=Pseudoclavibacter helvolus TaxID=255205 RepID=A0A7W4UQW1_9MICO|nr:Lrp/AsnC family transcriptional regulator [Pseudoclavibacter helvolus]MBB2958980.1 DNA-binding Lrp family transcriptional regulator [Pseudoclavibacter helvolus]